MLVKLVKSHPCAAAWGHLKAAHDHAENRDFVNSANSLRHAMQSLPQNGQVHPAEKHILNAVHGAFKMDRDSTQNHIVQAAKTLF